MKCGESEFLCAADAKYTLDLKAYDEQKHVNLIIKILTLNTY